YVLSMFVLLVPAVSYAGRPLGIRAGDVMSVVWRQGAGALAATAVGFAARDVILSHTSHLLSAVLLTALYLVLYTGIVVGVLRVRTPLRVIGSLVRSFRPNRFADPIIEHA